jgi:hypothetical protein
MTSHIFAFLLCPDRHSTTYMQEARERDIEREKEKDRKET